VLVEDALVGERVRSSCIHVGIPFIGVR
jgi:hypothetical protein